MRPINLIPRDERRHHGGAPRTGPVVYILVGSLAVLLIGVVMLVLTSNTISDRESEIESLESQKVAATAQAARLAPYVSFQQLAQQRIEAVTTLADTRFDWERVIRQLAYIIPPEVRLSNLTAAATGGEGSLTVTGPSMTMAGCAPGQDYVAAFVASLKQIDGVTRVGLQNSGRSGGGTASETRCKEFEFKLTIAFDEAPLSPDAAAAGGVVVPEPAPEETSEGEAPAEGEPEAATEEPPAEEAPAEGTASSGSGGEEAG
jgi:Tfp pilus assembly protein PilN